jgi:hypothetical protein
LVRTLASLRLTDSDWSPAPGVAVNYFAHALRHLHRPYFLAGLAVPDWLSVVDRRVRVRRRRIEERIPDLSDEDREIAAGIVQHLEDDRWFHGTPGFFAVTGEIGRAFRETLSEADSWRCGFLGHILMELLLDAALIEQSPARLADYYRTLEGIDPQRVQSVVTTLASGEPTRLAEFVGLFQRERFLEDYLDDARLLRRFNQVMRRVGLNPLPEEALTVLQFGRETVRERIGELLPETHFGPLP